MAFSLQDRRGQTWQGHAFPSGAAAAQATADGGGPRFNAPDASARATPYERAACSSAPHYMARKLKCNKRYGLFYRLTSDIVHITDTA